MQSGKRTFIGVLFLFLFCSYWCGISCFTHSHVENGVVIVHSHPFSDSHHHHTADQYETIFYITHFFSLEYQTYFFEGIVRYAHLFKPFILLSIPVLVLFRRKGISLRAPPIDSLS